MWFRYVQGLPILDILSLDWISCLMWDILFSFNLPMGGGFQMGKPCPLSQPSNLNTVKDIITSMYNVFAIDNNTHNLKYLFKLHSFQVTFIHFFIYLGRKFMTQLFHLHFKMFFVIFLGNR